MENENPYQSPAAAVPVAPMTQRSRKPLALLFSAEGRASRSEYWGLHILIVLVGGLALAGMIGIYSLLEKRTEMAGLAFVPGFPLFIAYIWSSIVVTVRRFHDRNKPGAMVLIQFVPYIGAAWIFVDCGLLPGTPGPNQYGPAPGRA